MKHTTAVLLALLCLCLPALAADAVTEITGGLTYSDFSATDVTQGSVAFDLAAGISEHFQAGPAATIAYMKQPSQTDTATGFGGLVHWNLVGRNGPFVGAKALYWTGDAEGYTVAPIVGVKFGGEKAFARITASRPQHYSEGERLDLQRTDVEFAFGIRF